MADAVFYALEALWCCSVVFQLRHLPEPRQPIEWPLIALVIALNTAGDLERYWHKHDTKWAFWSASLALYLYLRIFGGRGLGKKLWNKIVSAGLTKINTESFRRQTAEAK